MSKLETNTIDTVSGTANLTIGGANNTGTTTVKSNNTAAITVDSSQDVGIGETTPLGKLHVKTGDSGVTSPNTSSDELIIEGSGTSGISILSGNGSSGVVDFGDDGDNNIGRIIYSHADNAMQFHSNAAERMVIRSDGGVRIGTTNAAATDLKYTNSYVDGNMARFENNAASNPYGIAMTFGGAAPDDNTRYYLFCNDDSTVRLRIDSDGDVKNHDNSYGSLSDERIKQDIRDSNSQWDDIKNIRIRNFKKKDDVRQYGENAWEQIGVIAQELETVSPKLIRHTDPSSGDILSDSSFGTLYQEGDEIPEGKQVGDIKQINEQVKSVSYSVLYMKAIKALQEAQTRIETLEEKVTALENA